MKKIIIDTDPGIDDAMAIHLAFAHPELDVLGLTTIFGNVFVETATRNALRLIEMAGADCPVAQGASVPLVQALNHPADFVHGVEGFGNVPAAIPSRKVDLRSAAQFIVDMVSEHPGEITLCPVGPLTNIALALRLDPTITTKVAEVVIMGGAVRNPGNVSAWAEANIWNDPHAADAVLAADWPMTLVGLDVTEKSRCTPEDFATLAQTAPDIGGFLDQAVQFYFTFHRQKGVLDGCFMHDPSAVLAVTDPALFKTEAIALEVVCDGEAVGQTRPSTIPGRRPVEVCLGVDSSAVRNQFCAHLARADACRDARKS